MDDKFDFGRLERPFEADWPVQIDEPVDGGGVRSSTLMVRFRQLKSSEVDELVKSKDFDQATLPRRYFVGFGAAVSHPWSEAVRDQLLDLPHVRRALVEGYSKFTNGVAVKNSQTPPG